MMAERTYRGKVAYLHADKGETGREWFSVTVHGDGARTLRATCEMDDDALLRDVVVSLDSQFRPRHAYVHLVQAGTFTGSGWFRFAPDAVEAQCVTAREGRLDQRVAVAAPVRYFGTHPIVCDGLMAAVFDHGNPSRRQSLRAAASSSAPNGATGPMLHWFDMTVEYVGDERITVTAGTFDTRHYLVHLGADYSEPLKIWTHGPDHVIVLESWSVANSRYELVEYDAGSVG